MYVLESKYKVSTKCIAVDFTGGLEIFDGIASQLEGLEIGVLGLFDHCSFKYLFITCSFIIAIIVIILIEFIAY